MNHRPGFRLLALFAGLGLMGAQKCDDNLGEGSPGPTSFRISIAPGQVPANSDSDVPSFSADGRYCCFASRANNLANPTSAFKEIFVRDRQQDTVINVSRLANLFFPSQAADCSNPHMSPNGRYVVFESKNELTADPASIPVELYPGRINLFWVDLTADPVNVNRLGFELDGDCTNPCVSNDGKFAFQTDAPIDGSPALLSARIQVYVWDVNTSAFTLISHDPANPSTVGDRDSDTPRISADGNFVVFRSFATNLGVANPNLPTQSTGARRIWKAGSDGTGLTLVSRATGAAGTPADNHCTSPSISATGRYVAYTYQGGAITVPNTTGTSCIVRRDTDPGFLTTDLVATDAFVFALFIPYGDADKTGISADGRYVAFMGADTGDIATATDLAAKVRDMQGGTIVCSKHILTQGSTLAEFPGMCISEDGRWAAWRGDSALEVLGDTNAVPDVFGYGPVH